VDDDGLYTFINGVGTGDGGNAGKSRGAKRRQPDAFFWILATILIRFLFSTRVCPKKTRQGLRG
jgi:hypothetical protein